jgi:hypothetical protein
MPGVLAIVSCSLCAVALAGCSRPDTVEVSGNITWQGTPIPHGEVVFLADDPHVGVGAGKINAGAYRFRCKPGKKRVEIQAARNTGKREAEGMPISELYIPTRYNRESTLTVDVTLDGNDKFDFELKP